MLYTTHVVRGRGHDLQHLWGASAKRYNQPVQLLEQPVVGAHSGEQAPCWSLKSKIPAHRASSLPPSSILSISRRDGQSENNDPKVVLDEILNAYCRNSWVSCDVAGSRSPGTRRGDSCTS